MARLVPDDIAEPNQGPWHQGERDTLARLQSELPFDYVVFHGVHWARIDRGLPRYGELDFVIANSRGKLLAIEQKDAQVMIERNDLVVQYELNGAPKSVTSQLTRNIGALRTMFGKRCKKYLDIDHLFYLPESNLVGQVPSSVDPSRVVDCTKRDDLIRIILNILTPGAIPEGKAGKEAQAFEDIENFLSFWFQASPHIGLLGQRARTFSSRLSAGLATWASRLDIRPFRLHVKGTAGSGKTQLALDELRRASENSSQGLYVCFNRALADSMLNIAPQGSSVKTVHEIGKNFLESLEGPFDFDDEDDEKYSRMIQALPEAVKGLQGRFSCLVIDEAQDLSQDWINTLLSLATESMRVIVLEDPEQALYRDRRSVSLPGWCILNSPANYRSPKVVVDLINSLELTADPIEWGGAVVGEDFKEYKYAEGGLLNAIEDAIKDLINDQYKVSQIVVLTLSGENSSSLLSFDANIRIAGHRFKRNNGYTKEGHVCYTEGDLLLDTIFRFKGQASDAVILVDEKQWTPEETSDLKRRLFVGMTRARLSLSLISRS